MLFYPLKGYLILKYVLFLKQALTFPPPVGGMRRLPIIHVQCLIQYSQLSMENTSSQFFRKLRILSEELRILKKNLRGC